MKVRKAVMPVAGFGTRFLPATKATPKEMFPLVDKPVAQYAVEEAAAAGIEEVIFVTGRAKRAIEDHFDSNFELEHTLEAKGKHEMLEAVRETSELVKAAYVRQKEMLGWGDAILQAKALVGDEPFAVLLVDDVYTGPVPAIGELIDVYNKRGGAVVAAQQVPDDLVHRYGIIAGEKIEDKLLKMTDIIEKPAKGDAPSNHAAMGRYVLPPEIFKILETTEPGAGGEIVGTDAIRTYLEKNDGYSVEVSAKRHDAGEKPGYLKALTEIALDREDVGADYRAFLETLLKNK